MRKSARRGFTLAEVLVTVTIIAVLAAVMVPAVINQVAKGDEPSVAQDLSGIQTAITTFAADTRRFPQRLSQLGKSALVATDTDITAAPFDATAIAAYRGPYASIVAGHMTPTGATFSDSLQRNPLVTGHQICMQDSTSNSSHSGTSKVSLAQILELEQALDHDSDTTSTGRTTGNVQWTQAVSAGVTTLTAGTVRVCVAIF